MNRTTRITITLVVAVIITMLGLKYVSNQETRNESVVENQNEETTPISITNKEIKEKYFTGKVSTITGSGILVETANKYIEDTLSEFRDTANKDVPDILAKWGADSPIAQYQIYLEASQIESANTESIVVSEYKYTGGANGMSSYKVFTSSKQDNTLLSINDVIKKDQQEKFVAYVIQKLSDWRPEGMTEPVVFKEEMMNLDMDSFKNFALTDENLIIYFDKYAIGPGALGAIPFPLPLTEVNKFLTQL